MNLFKMRRGLPDLDDLALDAIAPSTTVNPSREYLMPSVERPQQVFVRGQGSWMWDRP